MRSQLLCSPPLTVCALSLVVLLLPSDGQRRARVRARSGLELIHAISTGKRTSVAGSCLAASPLRKTALWVCSADAGIEKLPPSRNNSSGRGSPLARTPRTAAQLAWKVQRQQQRRAAKAAAAAARAAAARQAAAPVGGGGCDGEAAHGGSNSPAAPASIGGGVVGEAPVPADGGCDDGANGDDLPAAPPSLASALYAAPEEPGWEADADGWESEP
jgi:hypothetical protein